MADFETDPDWMHGGFGLYVHWPFCQAKCPYCDFNSHVVAEIDQRVWADAYLKEIRRVGAETGGRVLRSVFFGGGTPSMMDAALVDAILTEVRATWPLANDVEITLEANPTSVEAERFAGYRDAGVNRISMGIQALNDPDLKALGRLHTAEEAMLAFETARSVFDRVSFDLIYARQDQSPEDWAAELETALSLAIDHLSLYQLTIEDGTAFQKRFDAGHLRGLPDEDRAIDMYEVTQSLCAQAGFAAYEVSNHAKPVQESRHNLIYWQSGDYVGIGPGAHGRITKNGERYATEAPKGPFEWLAAVCKGSGELRTDLISPEERLAEFLLMGLRVTDGVALERLRSLGGTRLYNNINYLKEIDMLETTPTHLRATTTGRPVLNAVLARLLQD